jgi:O-antigen/teichoic acid export membrane protein
VFYQLVKGERPQERLARFGKLYWCVTLLLGLFIAALAKDVLGIFVGPAYDGAYRVVPILVATQALTCLWHLVMNPLTWVRKTAYLPIPMVIAAAVSVGLNVLLIPSLGLVGAALAVFGANAVLTSFVAMISVRLYPVPYRYGHMVAAVSAAILTFYVAQGISMDTPSVTLAVRFLTLGIYPILLLALRVVTPAELRQVWTLLTAEWHRGDRLHS